MSGLFDGVKLKVPTNASTKVEDARSKESAIKYYDAKIAEFGDDPDKNTFVRKEITRVGGKAKATGNWLVKVSLHQMPVYLQMDELDDTVMIKQPSEDGSTLTDLGTQKKFVGISELIVDSQEAGIAWLDKFRASEEFDGIMERAAKGLKDMMEVEKPNVDKRTNYLYKKFCEDNPDDTKGWGDIDHKDAGTARSPEKAKRIGYLVQAAKRDLGYVRWRASSAS